MAPSFGTPGLKLPYTFAPTFPTKSGIVERRRECRCGATRRTCGPEIMRLLVVEDEARIAELVRSGLMRAGFTVDTAETAADAVAALEVTNYDAAILDLGLPDGDGLD